MPNEHKTEITDESKNQDEVVQASSEKSTDQNTSAVKSVPPEGINARIAAKVGGSSKTTLPIGTLDAHADTDIECGSRKASCCIS